MRSYPSRTALGLATVAFVAGVGIASAGPIEPPGGVRATVLAAASSDSVSSDADLAASTAPPWTPAEPVRSEAAWETALRLPLRIATFPLSLVGKGFEGTLVYVEETSLVPRVGILIASFPRVGLALMPASLGDRTGLGGMIGYRPPFLARVLGAELSGSLSKYTRTRVDLSYGPAELAYSYDWRPRERFFGYGLSTPDDRPSTYAIRTQGFLVGLAYPWRKLGQAPPREQLRVWAGPREARLLRGRENPSFETVYADAAPLFGERQEHFRYGLSLVADRRAGQPHWSHGGRVAVAVERFDDATSDLLAIRTPRGDSPEFTRVTAEGEAGVSFGRDPRTLRLAVRAVNQTGDASDDRLLPYDLQRLGGSEGLAGFEPGRFHDVDLVTAKLTYLFPLSRNLEFEIHTETGGVYPRLEDADFGALENSYGFSIRPRLDTAPLGAIGIDWSREGVRMRFTLGGVE